MQMKSEGCQLDYVLSGCDYVNILTFTMDTSSQALSSCVCLTSSCVFPQILQVWPSARKPTIAFPKTLYFFSFSLFFFFYVCIYLLLQCRIPQHTMFNSQIWKESTYRHQIEHRNFPSNPLWLALRDNKSVFVRVITEGSFNLEIAFVSFGSHLLLWFKRSKCICVKKTRKSPFCKRSLLTERWVHLWYQMSLL